MNASLSALLVMLLLVGGWLVGKRRSRPFLRSTDTADVASLNRAQIEQMERRHQEPAPPVQAGTTVRSTDPSPRPPASPPCVAGVPAGLPRQRSVLLHQLLSGLSGSRDQRLEAIAIARQVHHPALLPVLRRGLRDPDPAVMAAAAAAMDGFRGRPTLSAPATAFHHGIQIGAVAPAARPRKVSRTR